MFEHQHAADASGWCAKLPCFSRQRLLQAASSCMLTGSFWCAAGGDGFEAVAQVKAWHHARPHNEDKQAF
jgi:hypothetical protein